MGKSAKNQQKALSRRMFQSTEDQLAKYSEEQVVQRELLETQKQRYKSFEFQNPYADMENVMEDMTIDMRAADYQRQQGEQQRANILQALQGAAGGSGIASLAQTMANQGQLQAQQISANIGQQERQNTMMERQMANQLQQLDRQGQAMVRSAEMGRESTLLGMEYGGMAGANAGAQAAYANQMSAFGAQASMLNSRVAAASQITGAVIGAAGAAATGGLSAGGYFANMNK